MKYLIWTVALSLALSFYGEAAFAQTDSVLVQVNLPNGQIAKRDTVAEGEVFTFGGFPFPMQLLNGGELAFPDGSLREDIILDIELPDFAQVGQNSVSFGDSIASAVRFIVSQEDTVFEQYDFDVPVELTLPMPQNLPPAVGSRVSELVLSFVDTTGNFDTTGVKTTLRDSILNIVKAEIGHFSDVAMTSEGLLPNSVLVQVNLPNGQIAKRDTVAEGDALTLAGLPFPMHHLNGGELAFPDSSLREDIILDIELPDFAEVGQNSVSFGDSIASAVRFIVSVEDTVFEQYDFDVPVELTLPVPQNLPPAMGSRVSELVLSFVDTTGNFDTTGVKTTLRDSVQSIVQAEISHFSDVAMTSEGVLDNSVLVQVNLPNGQIARRDTVAEGETFTLAGFAFPLQYLNGGELTFPNGSLSEDITLDIEIPDFAEVGQDSVSFGDSMASAVRFIVSQADTVFEQYDFEVPVELTLPIPQNLPPAVGSRVSELVLSFVDTTGNFDTTGVKTTLRDSIQSIVQAEISHFSDVAMTSETLVSDTPTHAEDQAVGVPEAFVLRQNYPNPFNPSTTIAYQLPEAVTVSLRIYDITGRVVTTLVDERQGADSYTVTWDGTTASGNKVASGIYFYRLKAGDFIRTQRMLLLR